MDYTTYHENSFEKRMSGTPLAGNFFLALWSLKGDLDYFAKGLNLRHYSRNEFCEYCPSNAAVDDVPMNWTNFRADALWKRRQFTVAQWRALHGEDLHWLWKEMAYLSQHNIDPDELHIMHLGTFVWMLGSLLWVLRYLCMHGSPPS